MAKGNTISYYSNGFEVRCHNTRVTVTEEEEERYELTFERCTDKPDSPTALQGLIRNKVRVTRIALSEKILTGITIGFRQYMEYKQNRQRYENNQNSGPDQGSHGPSM